MILILHTIKKNFRLYFILILTTLISCKRKKIFIDQENKDLSRSFEYYKIKYSKAINHFQTQKDSLKLKALYYILNNLDDQFFFQARWLKAYNTAISTNKEISVNDLIYKLDSIKMIYPTELEKIEDTKVITNDYLIRNIDRAFESRNNKWANDLSFEDFCEYVLPYKVGNEEPELWGTCLKNETFLSKDSLKNVVNSIDAVKYINDRLHWYKGTVNYDYPVDVGYTMTKSIGAGTCYSMSRMIAFQARAVGLPVVIDFAPSWGNRSEGHYWNALIYKNHTYPFDAAGPDIGFYKIEFKGIDRIPYKISKVFRKTFSIQNNSLPVQNRFSEPMPATFDNKRIKDVTDQYVPVSNITLKYSKKISKKFSYLCTFNNRNWIPSSWGTVDDRSITFNNMGRDMVYLPVCYCSNEKNSELVPIGNPFILFSNGQIKEIRVNLERKQTVVVTKKYPEDETNKIIKGDSYELLYWSNSWKSSGTQTAKGNMLYFSNVPSNALYWIRDLTQGKQERIFTYGHDQQIWW